MSSVQRDAPKVTTSAATSKSEQSAGASRPTRTSITSTGASKSAQQQAQHRTRKGSSNVASLSGSALKKKQQPQKQRRCPQCHDQQSAFFCSRCVSKQLRAYHDRVNKLHTICADAQDRIESIFGPLPLHSPQSLADTVTLPHQASNSASTSSATTRTTHTSSYDDQHSYPSILPDPFGDPGSEYSHTLSGLSSSPSTQRSLPPILPHRQSQVSQPSHIARSLRTERATLLDRIEEVRACLTESRQRLSELKQSREHQRTALDRRRKNLLDAKRLLDETGTTSQPQSQTEAAADNGSRWRLGRRRRSSNDTQPDITPDISSGGIGAQVQRTEADIRVLRRDSKAVVNELSRTRAILAREAFGLFSVKPVSQTAPAKQSRQGQLWSGLGSSPLSLLPDSMPAAFASPLRRAGTIEGRVTTAATGLGSMRSGASRTQQHQQYPPASSVVGATPASTPPNATTSSAPWKIVNLTLPSPINVRNHTREEINGALSYFSLLLQLLSAYLGIHLPFIIESQGGRNIIMPNELWSGTGAKKHIVHLSEASYEAFKTIATFQGERGNDSNGASAFGLGASALSVLESFVQLPSTARLTAMLGPSHPSVDGSNPNSSSGKNRSPSASTVFGSSTGPGGGGEGSGQAGTSDSGFSRSGAVDEYVSVLAMLSYNAAYLAHIQGIRVDLVSAATSPLSLLARAMESNKLGYRAHATYATEVHIRNLGRNDFDWNQLPMTELAKAHNLPSPRTPRQRAGKVASRGRGLPHLMIELAK
ncbi:hypothetical protein OC861_000275 [Tilletia horrida]|nr:hypothetical protein OC861_000275 [Tilletia horrida]